MLYIHFLGRGRGFAVYRGATRNFGHLERKRKKKWFDQRFSFFLLTREKEGNIQNPEMSVSFMKINFIYLFTILSTIFA